MLNKIKQQSQEIYNTLLNNLRAAHVYYALTVITIFYSIYYIIHDFIYVALACAILAVIFTAFGLVNHRLDEIEKDIYEEEELEELEDEIDDTEDEDDEETETIEDTTEVEQVDENHPLHAPSEVIIEAEKLNEARKIEVTEIENKQ